MSEGPSRAVSAILVSFNTRDLLLDAVASLVREPDVEVIVVDNASSDGSADAVAGRCGDRVTLVRCGTNLGFAAGVNRGAALARGDALLLLNPDAALLPGALARLRGLLDARPKAAVVGPALRSPDGRPQESAFRFPGLGQVILDLFPVPRWQSTRLNGRYRPRAEPMRVDFPLGACMLIRRAAWDAVGPLDPGYFMYVEEVDWCRRASRAGWEIWHEPRALVVHHGGQATSQRPAAMFLELWQSRLRYFELHHGRLFNRVVRLVVRLGMRAERRRALRAGNAARAHAAVQVLRLAR